MKLDYYCTWGKGEIRDGYKGVEEKCKTKIINTEGENCIFIINPLTYTQKNVY